MRLDEQVCNPPDDDDGEATNVLILKICFIVISFLEAMIAGLIPTWSSSCRESPKILGIANSFAGGVFLAIALMHITPEMIEGWNSLDRNLTPYPECEEKEVFPLPEMLIFLGYTIILVIDKVLFDTHALFDDHDEHGHHDPAEMKLETNLKASMAKADAAAARDQDPAQLRASRVEQTEEVEGAMKSYLNPHDRFATRMRASLRKSGAQTDQATEEQQALFVDQSNVNLSKNNSPANKADPEAQMRHSMEEMKKKNSCCPNMTPFILMIALSVHSMFEGLALGLQSTMSSVTNMVIAICIHKGAAASSLGISLVKTFPNDFKLCRWLVFTFSCATPLGVGIGMLVAEAGDIYEIVFSSIAAGSFVYIACSEVVVEEFSIPGNRYWKLLAFLLGAAIITCLFFLE